MRGGENHTVVTVNLDDVTEIGMRAVRRSYGLLGLGLGASVNARIEPFHLPGTPETDILLGASLESVLPDLRSDFTRWVTGHALGELLAGFGVFLDAVFESLELTARQRWPDDAKIQRFWHLPIAEKLDVLADRHGIVTNLGKQLDSLSAVANCLKLRHGVVSRGDCGPDDHLRVSWRAPARTGSSSGPCSGAARVAGLKTAKAPGPADLVLCERVFPVGDKVDLTAQDLREICFMTKIAVEEVSDRVLQRFRDQGVSIRTAWQD